MICFFLVGPGAIIPALDQNKKANRTINFRLCQINCKLGQNPVKPLRGMFYPLQWNYARELHLQTINKLKIAKLLNKLQIRADSRSVFVYCFQRATCLPNYSQTGWRCYTDINGMSPKGSACYYNGIYFKNLLFMWQVLNSRVTGPPRRHKPRANGADCLFLLQMKFFFMRVFWFLNRHWAAAVKTRLLLVVPLVPVSWEKHHACRNHLWIFSAALLKTKNIPWKKFPRMEYI